MDSEKVDASQGFDTLLERLTLFGLATNRR